MLSDSTRSGILILSATVLRKDFSCFATGPSLVCRQHIGATNGARGQAGDCPSPCHIQTHALPRRHRLLWAMGRAWITSHRSSSSHAPDAVAVIELAVEPVSHRGRRVAAACECQERVGPV